MILYSVADIAVQNSKWPLGSRFCLNRNCQWYSILVNTDRGYGESAGLVRKQLPCRHEDLSFILRIRVEKTGLVTLL